MGYRTLWKRLQLKYKVTVPRLVFGCISVAYNIHLHLNTFTLSQRLGNADNFSSRS